MKTLDQAMTVPHMPLGASKAEDLMTPNPMSIRQGATILEAAAFLAGRGISAAPVIGEAGRPVGVVSSTDILIHISHGTVYRHGSPDGGSTFNGAGAWGETSNHPTVRDVMTPGVFCVRSETSAVKLVEKMLALKVRRLFVVDGDGVLIGVISASNVLGKLRGYGPYGE
jgi:CBS domain-containing protein